MQLRTSSTNMAAASAGGLVGLKSGSQRGLICKGAARPREQAAMAPRVLSVRVPVTHPGAWTALLDRHDRLLLRSARDRRQFPVPVPVIAAPSSLLA